MRKLATWTRAVVLAATFGLGGAVTDAYAAHPESFCANHPLHPHCTSTGGLYGEFRAPFVANGTCDVSAGLCIGANVGDICTDNTPCQGEVDGAASLNSLGFWSVDTIGLTPSSNHDICLVFEPLGGVEVSLSLNADTNTNAAGDFQHKGSIEQSDLDSLLGVTSVTIVELFIRIFHDPPGSNGTCMGAGPGGSLAQVTGLTITPPD